MLARLAEDLFWAGRYLERAETTARFVSVTYHAVLDSEKRSAEDVWVDLLTSLGLYPTWLARNGEASVEADDVLAFLIADRDNAGSIVSSIALARSNVRNVRDGVSTELWEALNGLHLRLRGPGLQGHTLQPYELLRGVMQDCQLAVGVASETMARDEGWHFLTLGRLLERVERTARHLRTRLLRTEAFPPSDAFSPWAAALRATSSLECYRRFKHLSTRQEDVLEFLVLDDAYPRCLRYCLAACEAELAELSPARGRTLPERLLGRARATLEFRDVEELLEMGMVDVLEELEDAVQAITEAVGLDFFRHVQVGALRQVGALGGAS